MALAAYKTWSAGEILSAADLNASFNNILNNAADLVAPFTKNLAAGGFKITGLAVGNATGDSVRYEQLPFSVNDFRLTLTTATPVTTTDVTGATTLYCTPYKGNAIGLFDGTDWHVRTSAEFSLALGTLTSGKPYDVFCYDNAGVPTLEFLVWTSDTARATALTYQNGVLSKTGALTRRYMGTFYTTATTTTEDSLAKRFLWNYYNRVRRPMRVLEATGTWAYTLATVRQANGATANKLDIMVGVSEDVVEAELRVRVANTNTGVLVFAGFGLDVTNAISVGNISGNVASPLANGDFAMGASWRDFVGVGRHFLSWNEGSTATGTTTWSGAGGSGQMSGINGAVMA